MLDERLVDPDTALVDSAAHINPAIDNESRVAISASGLVSVTDTAGSKTKSLGTIAVAISSIGFGLSPLLATRAFDHGVTPISSSLARVTVLMVILAPSARYLAGGRR